MERKSIIYNELGAFCLAENEGRVTELGFLGKEYPGRDEEARQDGQYTDSLTPLGEQVAGELTEYLSGQRREFSFPVQPQGTPFQKRVWEALRRIPYGETRTYGQIAALAGSPKGARAVGMACNRNPVMIVIPCHRVVGSNGSLTGYACGLDIKKQLLELEGAPFHEQKKPRSGGEHRRRDFANGAAEPLPFDGRMRETERNGIDAEKEDICHRQFVP